MPIELASETVITLREATELLPRRRRGRKAHISCLYRWAKNGLRGVRLETLQVGGSLCTSVEAVQRFCDRLSEAGDVDHSKSAKTTNNAEMAARELDRLGF